MKRGDLGTDFAGARPTVAWLKSKGLTFVCRYVLDDGRNQGKALHKAEAEAYSAAGITICANFEYAVQPILTAQQGAADARTALAELERIGAPRRVVYFSFDYDVPPSHFPGVLSYLHGAETVLGQGNAGAYGKYDLIQFLAARGIHWLWQCYAWSYGKWSPAATVRQTSNNHWPGEYDADLDVAMADDIGGWLLGQPAGQEIEMLDWNQITPSGAPTYGMTLGDYFKMLGRGANNAQDALATAQAASAAVTKLTTVVQGIAGDESQDAAKVHAELAAIQAILNAAPGAGGGIDPAALANAISAHVGTDVALQVAEILGRTNLTVRPAGS